ncbi:MAG TPA: tetratricopeptide repeat protein [Candidatus Ozemobacteraceae bacterium]|nr:tetratricopeptide repeat protein [Candidatus Ozemobacteraceae bacterium]
MNSYNNTIIWFVRLGLVLLTTVAFFPALEAGFITWDDPAMVLDNPYFHDLSPTSLLKLFSQPYMTVYQPLTVLSLAVQFRVAGMDPFFFHLGNLLLHIANVLLALELSRRLGLRLTWACAAAALFAVHPGRVESVAWITERKDVLFAFFYLLGLHLQLAGPDTKAPRLRLSVTLCVLLSLLSKPTAISFPFVLAVLNHFKNTGTVLETMKQCRFLFIIIGIVGIIAVSGAAAEPQRNQYHDAADSGVADRIGRVFIATGALFRCVAVPIDIPLFIPYVPPGQWPPQALSWGIASALFCALLVASRKAPLRYCGLLFFPVALLPVSAGIFFHGLGQFFTASWHAYLPAFGLFLCVADALQSASAFLRERKMLIWETVLLAAALCAGSWMAHETALRCAFYQDAITFWNEVVRQTPHYIAFNNRGMAQFLAGDAENARSDFRIVTRLQPRYARGWVHLAAAELSLGRPNDARAILEKAVAEWPGEPMIHDYLGLIAAGASRTAEAVAHYSEALRLDPGYVASLNNRAALYLRTGEVGKAIADLDAALRIKPGDMRLRNLRNSIVSGISRGGGD